jgi:hypothetical protein
MDRLRKGARKLLLNVIDVLVEVRTIRHPEYKSGSLPAWSSPFVP